MYACIYRYRYVKDAIHVCEDRKSMSNGWTLKLWDVEFWSEHQLKQGATINLDPHVIVMTDLEFKAQMIEIIFLVNINNIFI